MTTDQTRPLADWELELLGDSEAQAREAYRRRRSDEVEREGLLDRIDAAVEGRCAGPGCGQILTERSVSAYFCGPTCQEVWNRQRTHRPEWVRGSTDVAPGPARWRPELESNLDAFDATDLELVRIEAVRGYTRRWYRRAGSDTWWFRLDDGHRFVGADVAIEIVGEWEASDEVWSRLARELTDPRRLDPEPVGSSPLDPLRLFGDRPINLTPYVAPGDGPSVGDAIRRVGEQIASAGAGAIAAYSMLPEATRRAIEAAVQAESDRVALRAVCTDEAMYERALDTARERGWSVSSMLAAVVNGIYTESGWTS